MSGRSSSSLTGYSDQFIRGAGEGRRVRNRREEIRRWKRWSILKGQNLDKTDETEGPWGLERSDRPVSLDRNPGNDEDGDLSLNSPLHSLTPPISTVADHQGLVAEVVVDSVQAHETVPLSPLVYDASRYSPHQHQLVRRASGSGNGPMIIGATVGGLCFVGILVVAIVVWHRRLKAKERQFVGINNEAGETGRTLAVTTRPEIVNNDEDKLDLPLEMVYRGLGSTHGTRASRSSSANNRSRSAPTSPIDKTQIRHHSWAQAESILGSHTAPAIAGVQIGGRIPSRATTPHSIVSSPSSMGKKSKRSSSLLQRFGHSRDLSSPGSLSASVRTLSTKRGPPPPRPPRPDEEENRAEEQPQIFELSASSSVRAKRNSKPLPVLPTFLVREHEEEMRRRREEYDSERRGQCEPQREPQSPVDDSRNSTPLPPVGSSGFPGGSGEMGMLANQEEVALKKVMSLDSLASTTTSSSSDCDDEGETGGGSRRPTPEVNPLSPRSSQRRPARREGDLRAQIPSFANTEAESVATGGDSLMKRTSYLIADGSSGVEATAVAPGFPSPKLGEKLRLTPPLPSSTSTDSSNISSVFGLITAPVSATVAKPPTFPPPDQSRDESPGAHTRTESTSSGGIAASGEHQDTRGALMLAESSSERGLAFGSIEDWRESVGETYAGTRPTTAGAASMGPASAEDVSRPNVPVPPVVFGSAAAVVQPRPVFPRRISVDTGVGGVNTYPPLPAATTRGAFLTPSTATSTSARSPFTPIEVVPVSAVTPPSNTKRTDGGTLKLGPPTSGREGGLEREAEGAPKAPKPELVPGPASKADERARSWLNIGDDSDSDDS